MEQIIRAITHYCQYQERCHYEVKEKLAELGSYGDDAAEIMAGLIEQGLLNETRFACAFAGGKFRMLKWGRNKIIFEMKQKRISPYNIKAGLAEIEEDTYLATLQALAEKKWLEIKHIKSKLEKKRKLTIYLIQKGYENALVYDLLNSKYFSDKNYLD